METTLESASDYSLAVFVGTLFALLVLVIIMGGRDDLRRGIRALFSGETTEPYKAATLEDYKSTTDEDEEE